MKKGFVPIKLNEFVEKHIKSNPDTSRKEIETEQMLTPLQNLAAGVFNCSVL
jgi:hypothetical protein